MEKLKIEEKNKMRLKLFTRIFGIILVLISIILFIYSIGPLINWFSNYGFVIEFEMPMVYFAISILFLLLGLIYTFIPEEKINKKLKTSVIIALSIIIINLGYFISLYLIDKFTNTDMMGFTIIYIALIFPMSLIVFIVSIILALIPLLKKRKIKKEK